MKTTPLRTFLAVLTAIAVGGLLLSSGCTTFEAGVLQTPTPNRAQTATVRAIQTSNARLTALLADPPASPTPRPEDPATPGLVITPTPTTTGPRFSSLRFAAEPDAPAPQRFYVAGVNRVYALWDYANMQPGMTVRRVWTLNSQVWIEREDLWDTDLYGSSGTVRDVSVFDDNIGLLPGEYSLSLYIDGIRQDLGAAQPTSDSNKFWIFPSEIRDPVNSPDLQKSAYVLNGGRLFVEFPDGSARELAATQEIASLAWFPDSRNLLYAERDRSMQVVPSEDWGVTHRLWIINVETGERHILSTSGENFHHPQISPNGRYVAALVGNTFGEGCFYSPSLTILMLNEELRRADVYKINSFTGIPYLDEVKGGIYPNDHTRPGVWEGSDKLLVNLWWLCLDTPDNPDGTYLLDMSTLAAQRVATQP